MLMQYDFQTFRLRREGLDVTDVVITLGVLENALEAVTRPEYPGPYEAFMRGMWDPLDIEANKTEDGRWPANVILTEEAARILDTQGPSYQKTRKRMPDRDKTSHGDGGVVAFRGSKRGYAPEVYGDGGGASKYFKKLRRL